MSFFHLLSNASVLSNSIACHEIQPTHFECMRRLSPSALPWCPYKGDLQLHKQISPNAFFYVHENCLRKKEDPSEFGQQLTYPHLSIDSTLMEKVFAKTHLHIYTLSWSLWIELFGLSFFFFVLSLLFHGLWFGFCSSQSRAHPPRLFERLRQGDG